MVNFQFLDFQIVLVVALVNEASSSNLVSLSSFLITFGQHFFPEGSQMLHI